MSSALLDETGEESWPLCSCCRWTGGGGAGREVRVFTVFWLSDEYHHSRNCRKKTPKDRDEDRDKATPRAPCDISHNALCTRLQTKSTLLVKDIGFISMYIGPCARTLSYNSSKLWFISPLQALQFGNTKSLLLPIIRLLLKHNFTAAYLIIRCSNHSIIPHISQ